MPVKVYKNKLHLYDELEEESYIVNTVNDVINNKDYIPVLPKKKQLVIIKNETSKETKKSPYIIFVSKMTNKYKEEYPNMSAKERREKVLNLWKIEKDK